MNDAPRRVLLMDNGSLEPASARQLRRLANDLAARIGERVDPVSLAHSDKIAAWELDGRPAELFEAALDRCVAEGVEDVIVAPLFVGPSHAVVRHAPTLAAQRKELTTSFTPPLFVKGETRLGEIVADLTKEKLTEGVKPCVAVVDHGSPTRAVTDVRDAVTTRVRAILGDQVATVAACSMERRPAPEFDFNEPLLENLLVREGWRSGPLVIALLFIAPGKHAGPDGDVAQIAKRARGGTLDDVTFTRVMGTHPRLVEILAERVRAAM